VAAAVVRAIDVGLVVVVVGVGLAVVVVVGPKSEFFWWRLGIRLRSEF
jgi:hypothetical protein